MVFSSTVFLFLFLPIVVLIYYNPLVRSRTFRNVFLLIASLGFYAWGEPVFVFLMLLSILVTWLIGLSLGKQQTSAKAVLTVGVVYHIAVLFVFKYLGFVLREIGTYFTHTEVEWNITLPIGISFFTFQMLSYLFDVYYKNAAVQKNPLNLALYVALFPQLIAGPIVRYNEIEAQILGRQETFADFSAGMERFLYGLGKKVLLSNYLAYLADSIFDADERSVLAAWLGAIAYTLQIYFDFSGYSDMAIGLGRMFGFRFSENFNYPYVSKSVTEFWRRWHISLSSWFRDYVYIPLGGNRVSRAKWVRNLFIVWALTGVWHGADWTFLLWGLFYFILLLLEKLTGFAEKLGFAAHIYTMLMVTLAWVLFRADDLSQAGIFLGNMFGVNANGIADGLFRSMLSSGAFVLIVSIILSAPVYRTVLAKIKEKSEKAETITRAAVCLIVFVVSLVQVVASTYNPFIYFNF